MANLQQKFKTEIAKRLQEDLKIGNNLALPRLLKIVVNAGVSGAVADKKAVEVVGGILTQITGQKPKVTTAKKSISSFKLREGDKIGLVVTLRGQRMYDFFERLVGIVLPRIKDFRGVKKKSFDSRGNYTLGISEYVVFPEVDSGRIDRVQGLEICIVTTAKERDEAVKLLTALG